MNDDDDDDGNDAWGIGSKYGRCNFNLNQRSVWIRFAIDKSVIVAIKYIVTHLSGWPTADGNELRCGRNLFTFFHIFSR